MTLHTMLAQAKDSLTTTPEKIHSVLGFGSSLAAQLLWQLGFLGSEWGLPVSAVAVPASGRWARIQRPAARGGGLSSRLAAGRKLLCRGGKVHQKSRQWENRLVCLVGKEGLES